MCHVHHRPWKYKDKDSVPSSYCIVLSSKMLSQDKMFPVPSVMLITPIGIDPTTQESEHLVVPVEQWFQQTVSAKLTCEGNWWFPLLVDKQQLLEGHKVFSASSSCKNTTPPWILPRPAVLSWVSHPGLTFPCLSLRSSLGRSYYSQLFLVHRLKFLDLIYTSH